MRLRVSLALLALAAACGGGGEQAANQSQQAQPGMAAPTGPVVDVQMTGTPDKPVFSPNTLTIAAGTTVRFINVAAGPHNVMFPADSIPAGAAGVLGPAMDQAMGPTMGPLNGH